MFTGYELQVQRIEAGHCEANVAHDAEISRSNDERASQRVVRRATVREMIADLFRNDRRLR
ncbi:MAG: hypothetical protein ABWY58_02425 [Aeromicrobium sp.]